MYLRIQFILFSAISTLIYAQEPLNNPVPFAAAPSLNTVGQNAITIESARLAQELGFPGIASGIYKKLLAQTGGDRTALNLDLAEALLDEGNPLEASQVLNSMRSNHGPVWHLRSALAALALKQFDLARSELNQVKVENLGREDQAWAIFAQGVIANISGDYRLAGEYFSKAESLASTQLTKARFELAHDLALLRLGRVSQEEANQAKVNSENNPGSVGYDFARAYAVMLYQLGRRNQSIEALQHNLMMLPVLERSRIDDLHFLLGMISGVNEGAGRNSLFQLLETGSDTDRQREALQLLARGMTQGFSRDILRQEVDKLIANKVAHPILDDLLLLRATLALQDSDFITAEDKAQMLLDRFPGSNLKPYALGILADTAWEQQHYRTAADYARQTKLALSEDSRNIEVRKRLSAVIAEAWFRARDYRNAADAYASVILNPPSGIALGDLIFQRVEAEIKAVEVGTGSLTAAEEALDQSAKLKAFDSMYRWQAEWNLARALQLAGKTFDAYTRINTLLIQTTTQNQLPAELRARMAWLQARLAVDARDLDKAIKLVDSLGPILGGVNSDLKQDIASSSLLLKAQIFFEQKKEDDAVIILKQLRAAYPAADSAVSSYFVQAEHEAQQDRVVEAQRLLTDLADRFPTNRLAPYALYQASTYADRLGRNDNFQEADRLLERLVTTYPQSELVFDARLKQGDLLRKLNQFPQAQRAYESLIKNPLYVNNPNSILARLALAECHNAQSGTDPLHEESARSLFEDICEYRVDAPVDIRVEAGYNLGNIYRHRGRLNLAKEVWWSDVVKAFLINPLKASELGSTGRFWMAKTLMDLAQLFNEQGQIDQAIQAWQRVIEADLPGAALAKSNITNLNSPAAKF